MLRTGFLILAFALAATAASAQSSSDRGQWRNQVRVSVAVNFFVAAPTDSSPQALKAQEEARRKVYEIAHRECAVLLDVMADDCRMENMNVNINVNRNYNPQMGDGFTIAGNMSFRVNTK
jgi:hypothetical protein